MPYMEIEVDGIMVVTVSLEQGFPCIKDALPYCVALSLVTKPTRQLIQVGKLLLEQYTIRMGFTL